MLYCVTTDPHFYSLKAALAVTSADNGGKYVVVTMTYGTAFDDVTNNADVLLICCAISNTLMM